MPIKSCIVLMLGLGMLAGCAAIQGQANKVPLDNDPRIGEKVSHVCFTRNINGWNSVDNDRNAVIISLNIREQYKLKLVGACDPDLAMMRAAFITRPGSSCLSRGDKVKTDGDLAAGRGTACTIMAINKWLPDALEKAGNKPESSSDTQDKSSASVPL